MMKFVSPTIVCCILQNIGFVRIFTSFLLLGNKVASLLTATAMKTSLKKGIRAASNFIALVPSCSIRCKQICLELNSKRLYRN